MPRYSINQHKAIQYSVCLMMLMMSVGCHCRWDVSGIGLPARGRAVQLPRLLSDPTQSLGDDGAPGDAQRHERRSHCSDQLTQRHFTPAHHSPSKKPNIVMSMSVCLSVGDGGTTGGAQHHPTAAHYLHCRAHGLGGTMLWIMVDRGGRWGMIDGQHGVGGWVHVSSGTGSRR